MDTSAKTRLMALGALLSFSSIFQMGYTNAYPNTAIDGFRTFLTDALGKNGTPLSTSGFSWLWSAILNVWFVGFAVGSWIAVPLADRIGRRNGLLIGNVLNFLSAVLATVSIIVEWTSMFTVSRLIFAIAAAISMNCLILLLQEASPTSMRGAMSFYAEMAFVMMNMVGAFAGMRSILGSNLVFLVGLSCIPTLLSVLITIPFHESPKYLLMKKKDRAAAVKSLHFYQRTDTVECKSILDEYLNEESENGSFKELLTVPHLRRGLLLGITALQVATSIWPIVYFSTEFMVRAGIPYGTSETVSTVMLLLSTFCTVIGMVLVERINRRILFLSCGVVNLMALVLYVICANLEHIVKGANSGCIAAIILHGCSYSLALGPIAWFITAELLPLEHRAMAQSIALSVNQLTALVLCFVTLPLFDILGSFTLLPLFIVPGAVALIIIYKYLPETRDREIAEVIEHLKGAEYVSSEVEMKDSAVYTNDVDIDLEKK